MASQTDGKLKIGDNWNAIRIIALSQNNPLKAIAEFVENSIDAGAQRITLIRGKRKGENYLKVVDDGSGIDDLKYVATHIADSIKRRLKKRGAQELQGEFGIGLLSFWTVGEELVLTTAGTEGVTRRMKLVKDNPGYSIQDVPRLTGVKGTELLISPILAGMRQLSGEKIQNYLASELRDRIARSGVTIRILDHSAKKEFQVEPRKFAGRLLHHLPEPRSPFGEIYSELYLTAPSPENRVGLYRRGTRVVPDLASVDVFRHPPWTSGYLEGLVDVSFLQLTPGTRDGFIYDDAFASLAASLELLESELETVIQEQKRAEEDTASRNILKKVSRAFREAMHFLPPEEYGWLEVGRRAKSGEGDRAESPQDGTVYQEAPTVGPGDRQKEFFDYPGPLHSVIIRPGSAVMRTGASKKLTLLARDKSKRQIAEDLDVRWKILEGDGAIDTDSGIYCEFTAGDEPGLVRLGATVRRDDARFEADALITVTEELLSTSGAGKGKKGLPGYTFDKAPGQLWRSRYDRERGVIVINNGHADFIYASKSKSRKLRYVMKLYSKELVLSNFPELSKEELLERVIELQLYAEEQLR